MITLADKTVLLLRHVVTMRPLADGSWDVRVSDGTVITVSSDDASAIRRALVRCE
jgi:hypothetical protein